MRFFALAGIVVLGVVMILSVFGIISHDTDSADAPSAPAALSEPVEELEPEPPNPVSLPALMQKEFDGRDFTLGAVLAENESYTRYTITYKSGDLTISGIMNIPKGEGPHPLLVLNHGYINPAVYTNGRGLKREQDYLARRGFAVIHPDYRNHAFSDKVENPEHNLRLGYTEDVINAVYAVREAKLSTVDASRVGMLGHSMGGGVALNVLVVQPALVGAAVLFAPVSGNYRDNFERWIERRPETARQIFETFGTFEDDPAFWENVSPETFYEDIVAPIMVHHGDADDSVPIAWSDKLVVSLQEAGQEPTYHTYPGEPHEFTDAWPRVMERTAAFFTEHLK